MLTKIIEFVKKNNEDIVLFVAIVLASMFSFSLGYIIAKTEEKEPLEFEKPIYEEEVSILDNTTYL